MCVWCFSQHMRMRRPAVYSAGLPSNLMKSAASFITGVAPTIYCRSKHAQLHGVVHALGHSRRL